MTTTSDVLPVVARADRVPGAEQGRWTYDDYAAIPADGNRYEVIDGVLYMTPAPNTAHQAAAGLFTTHLTIHVQFTGLGTVLVAPFDVELMSGHTVVQPDIVVILKANHDILTPLRAIGAPDLVVEIASPSTATHDRHRKMDAYAAAGVREYWIADPHARTIELLRLENGSYQSAGVFQGQAMLPSLVAPGFPVPVDKLFGDQAPVSLLRRGISCGLS